MYLTIIFKQVKGHDNDGQGSFDNNRSAEKNFKPIPLVPYQPEVNIYFYQ